jgi:hypothetical protein
MARHRVFAKQESADLNLRHTDIDNASAALAAVKDHRQSVFNTALVIVRRNVGAAAVSEHDGLQITLGLFADAFALSPVGV